MWSQLHACAGLDGAKEILKPPMLSVFHTSLQGCVQQNFLTTYIYAMTIE
jgi:hypothetical protein